MLKVTKDRCVKSMLAAKPNLMLFASFKLEFDQMVALTCAFTALMFREIDP